MERYLGGNLDEHARSVTAFLRAGDLLNASDERLASPMLMWALFVLSWSRAAPTDYQIIAYRNTLIYFLGTVMHNIE